MKPFIKEQDIILFYKYLDNATNYLEYGSGGSTYQAAIRNNIINIISVESDLEWHNKLKSMLHHKTHIDFKYINMKSRSNNWGYPGTDSTINDWINYSNVICNLDYLITQKIDLILIDGRFRVACCLKCFDVINDNCYILFDDFLYRPEYHIVLKYYDIVEKTTDNSMVVLKKKNIEGSVENSLRIQLIELISVYEKIAD